MKTQLNDEERQKFMHGALHEVDSMYKENLALGKRSGTATVVISSMIDLEDAEYDILANNLHAFFKDNPNMSIQTTRNELTQNALAISFSWGSEKAIEHGIEHISIETNVIP
ncbi:hypothetical protein WCE14_09310 [Acinetobacter schindleri]|uniref:Uncharacterized protein n=1 Tax=Acinetobacter schindleri NIPH 900 TaxID=1217675 RepID=N8Y4Z7_9GAMM|nr:hypothetical protein [Acinetobacter schindleri]ENV14683.1 hypothetical protein F965_00029 [Acinetobacter schindleri NIPH 900]